MKNKIQLGLLFVVLLCVSGCYSEAAAHDTS